MTINRLRLGLGIFLLASFVYFSREDVNIVYGGDTWGYYGYLPSIFIYGDIKNPADTYLARFQYTNEAPRLPEKQGEFTPAENGNNVIKYTSGVAMLQLPFFLVAHFLAAILPNVAVDGYSWPYRWLINLSVIFYYLLAIGWLFKALRTQVNDKVAGWTIILLTIGSNLFNFLIFRGPMAHGYLFSMYALLIWSTIRFYQRPNWKYAIGVGLSAGLITLMRPVEIICLLIPLAYGISSWTSLKARGTFILQQYPRILLAVVVYAFIGFLHLCYWKYVSGEWLFFSYGEEGFDWKHSRIYAGLFDYKNGWLRYSPLLWLALFGVPLLWKGRKMLLPVLLFLPLHIYITYAWWNWYYINGFGSRPMVETYALLAFPLAIFLAWITQVKAGKVVAIIFAGACVVLNLFQHEQHLRGVLWTEEGNEAYYWSVFGKLKTDYRTLVSFVSDTHQPKHSELEKARLLYHNDFEEPALDTFIQSDLAYAGHYALAVPASRQFTNFFGGHLCDFLDCHKSEGPGGQQEYVLELRFHARKEIIESPWYTAPAIVMEGKWPGGWRAVRIDPLLGNPSFNTFYGGKAGVWDEISFLYPLPAEIDPSMFLQIYLMNAGQTTYLDELSIYAWQKK